MPPPAAPVPLLPPQAERVLVRGLILCHLGLRASLDLQAGHDRAAEVLAELGEWTRTDPVVAELEEDELRLLTTPLGALTPAELLECSWEFEAAAVLGWALRLLPLPAHDRLAEAADVLAAFGTEDPAVMRALLGGLRLRPAAEIARAAARNHAVRVRLARRRFQDGARPPGWTDAAFDAGVPLRAGDLVLDGRPVAEADEARIEECLLATGPRWRAFRWMRGEVLLYSDAPRPGRVLPGRPALAPL